MSVVSREFRCQAILKILATGPKTPQEIAKEHFEPGLLKGYGIHLAINEIKSHCELMEISGDVVILEDRRVSSTGGDNFRALINGADRGRASLTY